MYQIDNRIQMLHFDLELTKACNMRCDYCFEEKFPKRFDREKDFIYTMNRVLESDFFKRNYGLLNINFWGGEPTLESNTMNDIVDRYKDDDRVKFFIFSNGYDIDKTKSLLYFYKNRVVKGNHPKVSIQISYDGPIIHDIHRKDIKGESTSKRVIDNILWLDLARIPYILKPVISPKDFRHLLMAYNYVKKLTYEDDPSFFKSQNYNPTIEYYNCEEETEEEVQQNLYELRKSLIEIAAEEYVHIKDKGGKPFFSWFYPNKAICSAGINYFAVGVDGKLYPCHGCLYIDERPYFEITNIGSKEFVKDIENWSMNHKDILNYLPIECKECDTNFCMKCNVSKFENSKKTKYIDRWIDYTNQKNLCKYFKEIGKVSKIFNKKMRNK